MGGNSNFFGSKMLRAAEKRFLHPSHFDNPARLAKSGHILQVLLVSTLIVGLYLSFYLMSEQAFTVKIFHTLAGLFVLLIGVIFLKYSGNVDSGPAFVLIGSTILLAFVVCLNGGFASPDLYWFIVIIVAGTAFVGAKTGFLITFLSVSAVLTFQYLDWAFVIPESQAQNLRTFQILNFTLVSVLILVMYNALVSYNQKLEEIVAAHHMRSFKEELARDFHDTLGNKLASIISISDLAHLKVGHEQQEYFGSIKSLAQETYQDLNDLIWTIDPQNYEIDKLYSHVQEMGEKLFSRVGIDFFSKISLHPDTTKISGNVAIHLISIVKESFTNILKHADATQVRLSFWQDQELVMISIADNGQKEDKGIRHDHPSTSRGINNMRKRAELIQGKLEVVVDSPSGFEVRLSIHQSHLS